MCPPATGAVQGADERAALCRAGGLQADEEEGEGDVPPPASPGHLIPIGEYMIQRGNLNLKRDHRKIKAQARLFFGSHETSPILWIGKHVPAI
jgi:hypothetical protein